MKAIQLMLAMAAMSAATSGCSKPAPEQLPAPQAAQSAEKRAEIAWFEGTVPEALAKGAAESKPVFLYWGAEWCPYCKDLKANVFSRSDFVEKSRLFVPVYLDGDDAGAQKLADQFHISGYPTVIVLRGDGKELARIGGGMDRNQYAGVLDLVLGDTKPVGELLASLDASGAALSADDCRRLAYNGWSLDEGAMTELPRLAAGLENAAERCPADARVERARLTVIAAALTATVEAGKPLSPRLRKLLKESGGVLGERGLAVSIADAWQYVSADFFVALGRAEGGKSAEALQRWNAVMDAIAADPRYTAGDQLGTVANKLVAAQALDPQGNIPAALAEEAKRSVDTAVAKKYDEYTRAGVVNAALNILAMLEDQDRAYQVAEAEVKTSHTPYYYMSTLGSIEEKRGHRDLALGWFERGYRESKGAATRVQWGTSYVNALIRMVPEDEARIQKAALEVLGELSGPDALHSRTRTRLGRMETSLRKWNGQSEHEAAVAVIRKRMDAICAGVEQGAPAREICAGFLAKA